MRSVTLFVLLSLCLNFFAVNDNTSSDALSLALGGASVATDNVYSGMNNPAVVAFSSSPVVAMTYASRFSLSDVGLTASIPTKFGVFGVNAHSFGSSNYAEMKYAAYYARAFGEQFSASLQVDALSLVLNSQGESLWCMTAEIGLWYRVTKDLTFGFHLYNMLNTEYETYYYDEPVPVNLKLGLAYSVFDNFMLTTEIENSSVYGTSLRGGMQYTLMPQVFLRCGGASNPALASLGIGVEWHQLKFDIAAQAVRIIGKTGAFSIAYIF